MAVINGYISVDQLKDALRDRTDTHEDLYAQAINAASRQIDKYLRGQVWKTANPMARVFQAAADRDLLFVDPFATKTGLIVKTDEDQDGTFETTWAASDYQAEPLRAGVDKPFRVLAAVGDRCWPGPYSYRYRAWGRQRRRAQVEITATWGWPSVPWQVVQACQILAIDHFKSKDLTGGMAGANEISAGQFGSFRFSGVEVDSFSPQARALLKDLAVPVFA